MRNSLKIANTSFHDEVWDILTAADNVSYSAWRLCLLYV